MNAGFHKAAEAGAEWTRLANGSEGIVQNIGGFIRRQNRSTAIRYKGEEEGATGSDGASMLHGECRVTLRCPELIELTGKSRPNVAVEL